jgi:hypothetical protein
MSDLLTAEEYATLASTISIAGNAFVDGASRPAASGETFATTNPATGKELARVAACGAADVDFAMRKARAAFEDGRWRNQTPAERKLILLRLAADDRAKPREYSACCCNGLGTVKSTLAGVLAADLATGSRSDRLEQYQAQPKPKRLPPAPIAWLGINAVIRCQELRAGREG